MRVLSWILKLPLGILMVRPPNMVGKRKAKIVRVVDGDTYVVRRFGKEFKVRIIGVDTPESCAPTTYHKTNTKIGKYVSEEVKNKLRYNMTVYLEYDKQRQDKYGRTLAYVYFPTGRMVQMWLLKNGYAAPMPIKPNVRYEELFRKTAAKAIKHRKGGMEVKIVAVDGTNFTTVEECKYYESTLDLTGVKFFDKDCKPVGWLHSKYCIITDTENFSELHNIIKEEYVYFYIN